MTRKETALGWLWAATLVAGLGWVGSMEYDAADGDYRDAVRTCETTDHNGCDVVRDNQGRWVAITR